MDCRVMIIPNAKYNRRLNVQPLNIDFFIFESLADLIPKAHPSATVKYFRKPF
jgi:hypothetical protein